MARSPLPVLAMTVVLAACSGARPAAPQAALQVATPPAATSGADDGDGDHDGANDEGDEPLPVTSGGSATTLFAEAERELAAVKSTTYDHHLSVDEKAGRFDYDCSSFVGYAVGRVQPEALQAIPHPGKRRPVAASFEAYFAAIGTGTTAGRWERVATVAAIEPGDVIAWKRPASSHSRNSGHIVIAHGRPLPSPTRPGTFTLEVVDSTAVPHGESDVRHARHATGLGTGVIGLVVDGSGAPRGYRWSRSGPVKTTEIAIGRLR